MTLNNEYRLQAVPLRKRLLARFASLLPQQRTFRLTLAICLFATLYWGVIASNRYVSEAHVIIQRTDLTGGQTLDFGSLLAGAGNTNRTEQLLLRDVLLSPDMLAKLDAKLHLRAHYSDRQRDPFSRMWSSDVSSEHFRDYYLSRVSVEFDDYAGVLVVKAQAYDPKTAQAIASTLVREGEQVMNQMAHQLAEDQVAFVERHVKLMGERFQSARAAVVAFQNRKGLVAPQSTAENLASVVGRLEADRTELQARRSALLAYLAPQAPAVVEINTQLSAIESQITVEKGRLTAVGGNTLNSTVEEFQRLELAAAFAQDVYKTALVALEKSQVEATRNLKKMTVLQKATMPQYPLEPRRMYNIVVWILMTLLIAGIVHLLSAIIRDHKD